jgi:hypothetical protein
MSRNRPFPGLSLRPGTSNGRQLLVESDPALRLDAVNLPPRPLAQVRRHRLNTLPISQLVFIIAEGCQSVGVFVPIETTAVAPSLYSALDVGGKFAIGVIVHRLHTTPSLASMVSDQLTTWDDAVFSFMYTTSFVQYHNFITMTSIYSLLNCDNAFCFILVVRNRRAPFVVQSTSL